MIKLNVLKYLFLLIVLVAMIFYHNFTQWQKEEIKKDPTDLYVMSLGYGSTFIYSLIIVLFGALYKMISFRDKELSNF